MYSEISHGTGQTIGANCCQILDSLTPDYGCMLNWNYVHRVNFQSYFLRARALRLFLHVVLSIDHGLYVYLLHMSRETRRTIILLDSGWVWQYLVVCTRTSYSGTEIAMATFRSKTPVVWTWGNCRCSIRLSIEEIHHFLMDFDNPPHARTSSERHYKKSRDSNSQVISGNIELISSVLQNSGVNSHS